MKSNVVQKNKLIPYDGNEKYDFSEIGRLIERMDMLRMEAKKSGDNDLCIIINSAFNICFSSYYLALRMRVFSVEDFT